MKKTWIDETIKLYDFIWEEGTSSCGYHVNKELMEDFAKGGSMFENMKKQILEKFPTIQDALDAFENKEEMENDVKRMIQEDKI